MPASIPHGSRVTAPHRVVVVGAGMVGLATAWFLQEHGVEVTVVDRDGVAAGSSWGNAGWLSPVMAIPLPEPSVLRYALRGLFNVNAPLSMPMTLDPTLWRFLASFAVHCTMGQWRRAMQGYLAVNREALTAFDLLELAGVSSTTISAPIMACFEDGAQSKDLRHEFALIEASGQSVDLTEISGDGARVIVPQIAQSVQAVVQINGQRYIDPGAFVTSLADSFIKRGGKVRTGFSVRALRHGPGGITVSGYGGDPELGDAVVVATGAWLNELVTPLGVRQRVQAGRGYSFSVSTEEPVANPIYFPAARVACTPYREGLRVGGTMEFRSPDHPIVQSRVEALAASARPLLQGVDWSTMRDVWVGPRPVSVDGLPLVGGTKVPGVFVAGGHGMWGITLGPITGKLLAHEIVTGERPAALDAFNPLR
ncbi:MAG: FAD-dependent oxidoreductase [Acidimicrobiales bacterium]